MVVTKKFIAFSLAASMFVSVGALSGTANAQSLSNKNIQSDVNIVRSHVPVKKQVKLPVKKVNPTVDQIKNHASDKKAQLQSLASQTQDRVTEKTSLVDQTKKRAYTKKAQAQSVISNTKSATKKVSSNPYDNKVKTEVPAKKAQAEALVQNTLNKVLPFHTETE